MNNPAGGTSDGIWLWMTQLIFLVKKKRCGDCPTYRLIFAYNVFIPKYTCGQMCTDIKTTCI